MNKKRLGVSLIQIFTNPELQANLCGFYTLLNIYGRFSYSIDDFYNNLHFVG